MWTTEQSEAAREARARYLQSLSQEESVQQFLDMMAEFGPLQETDAIFRPRRIQYLATLQARIAALNRGKTG
ncbi:MAG: hypothetical protein AB1758_20460 [Candidatus Eremiobacterota bacterium]